MVRTLFHPSWNSPCFLQRVETLLDGCRMVHTLPRWSIAPVFAEWSRPYFMVQNGTDPSSSELSGHLIQLANCRMVRAILHRSWSSPLFRQRLGTIGQMPHCLQKGLDPTSRCKMVQNILHRCFGSGSAALPRRVLLSFSVAPKGRRNKLIML